MEKLPENPNELKLLVGDVLKSEMLFVKKINDLISRQAKIEEAVRYLADIIGAEFERLREINDKISEILKD